MGITMPTAPRTSLLSALRRRQLLPAWVRRADVAVGRRINSGASHPAVDTGLRRLSRAADRGVLWFSIATALAVASRPRAGLRGVASLTAASILANLVGKKLFGGDRPLLDDIPVGRRLRNRPTSGSFPSGHSASAAAFATGVALESPAVGAALAPVAAGVAYSRLHVGAHWFSDVVGGVALGATTALVGRALVSGRGSAGPPPIPESIRVDLPALDEGEGVLVVLNGRSGASVVRTDPEAIIRRRLPKARIHLLGDGETLPEAVRSEIASNGTPIALGVCGGDGTVSAAAHLALELDLPLLAIPGGTFNHFVRAAGIESVDDAIDAVLAGDGVRADAAELTIDGGEAMTVLNAGSVGIYPQLVLEREEIEPRLGKWLAGAVAAARVLRSAEPFDIVVDGRRARVWSIYVGIDPNISSTVAPMRRHRLGGGVLDVRVLHARSRLHAVGSLAFGRRTSAFMRRLRLLPVRSETTVFHADDVEIRVRARDGGTPAFGHDGEVWEPSATGDYTATMRVLPGALRLYAPRR
jgi:membrane-associated phospholipid phosphatase/diacylglycerol kinase family enzyme